MLTPDATANATMRTWLGDDTLDAGIVELDTESWDALSDEALRDFEWMLAQLEEQDADT